jgi:hypothetical protein
MAHRHFGLAGGRGPFVQHAGARPDDQARGLRLRPSVAHYLLVETERRLIVHHHRAPGDDELRTSIVRAGALHLAPSGVDLDVDAIYAAIGM